jgi:DNA-binding transcriptional regulator YdaS (Cro superfamily)
MMEKEQAIKKAGSARKLAELLGISRAAISQWGANVPQARVWQLMALKPDWFAT